jgi:hypothetical protein
LAALFIANGRELKRNQQVITATSSTSHIIFLISIPKLLYNNASTSRLHSRLLLHTRNL